MTRNLVLLPLLLLPAVLPAQVRRLTIDDLLTAGAGSARGRGAGEDLLSPNGLYSVQVRDNELMLTPADGSGLQLLDGGPGQKSELHSSHDSTESRTSAKASAYERLLAERPRARWINAAHVPNSQTQHTGNAFNGRELDIF